MYPIIIDNFLKDPDAIRNYALNIQYREPNLSEEGWLGYRSFMHCDNLKKTLIIKVKKYFENINNLDYYFHYSLIETKQTSPYNFEKYKIHKDSSYKFAAVIYLHPQPPKNTGLSFYTDNFNFIKSVENVYNRFVFYPATIFHAPTDLFGHNKETGRLTLTIFCI